MKSDAPATVALFGGSFNPPHVGHLMVVTWLLATPRADQVWMMPTAHHPFGKTLAPFEDRVAMTRAAVRIFGDTARVEEIEGTLPAPSFTIDTLEALEARHPGTRFALVAGTDVLADTHKWKRFEELRTRVEWIPVRRAGVAGSESDPDPDRPTPLFPEVSSSDVRARLLAGRPVGDLVPEAVREVIRARGLYRA